jgi:hypothetical protein
VRQTPRFGYDFLFVRLMETNDSLNESDFSSFYENLIQISINVSINVRKEQNKRSIY